MSLAGVRAKIADARENVFVYRTAAESAIGCLADALEELTRIVEGLTPKPPLSDDKA